MTKEVAGILILQLNSNVEVWIQNSVLTNCFRRLNASLSYFQAIIWCHSFYIVVYEPGQPFPSHFVLYRPDFGLIKHRTSWCNKVDAVRLYASYRCRFTLTKGAEVRGATQLGLMNFWPIFIDCQVLDNLFGKYIVLCG